MQKTVVIDGGSPVRVDGQPAQGTRHEVLYGVLEHTGEPVVVKLERIPGALERERQALEEIAAVGGPAPKLLTAGTALVDGERLPCIVTERCRGETPTSDEGWWRMGRAMARFGAPSALFTQLPIMNHATFGQQHAQRVNDLGGRLDPLATAIPDWQHLISDEVPRPSPLVLTHGDPGPGNFLDDGENGSVIDWEDAHVAPRGLDLARLVFIALLGAGPSGFQARDQRLRARSVIDGYLGATDNPWRPNASEARWWTTVAGIQFVHRRWQMDGQPASWEEAAGALRTALTDGVAWRRAGNPDESMLGMEDSHEELVRRGFAAAARGDFRPIAALLAPDVKWHSGNPDAEGACRSREQVLAFMRRAPRRRTGPPPELIDVVVAGDRVVVVMQPDGDGPRTANLSTFRDGKVVEMVHYTDANQALREISR